MNDSEWYGEPHTLTVTSVRLPDGPLDDGDLGDYDLQHPPSCKQEQVGEGGHGYTFWTCDVAFDERECGLAASLRYSGTPVKEPGTYRIRAWGRRWHGLDTIYPESDAGVAVIDPEAAA